MEERVIETLIAAGRVRDPWGAPIDAVAKIISRNSSAREIVTGLVTRGLVHWAEHARVGPKGIRVTYSWRRGRAPALPEW
jgi:hypothetical protein